MPPLTLAAGTFAAGDSRQPETARFLLHADAEPGVLPRVLELFAKRGLVPRRCVSALDPAANLERQALTIDIEVAGLGRETAEYVAACMRQIAGVEAVLTA